MTRRIGERAKMGLATWLYRYSLVNGILGTFIALLTFVGVYTVALSGWASQQFGFSYLDTFLLMTIVSFGGFFGGGYVLDKHVKYWMASATVGTSRNPYLVDTLYNKELVFVRLDTIPHLKSLRLLVLREPPSAERDDLLQSLDTSIERLENVVREKKFDLQDDERVY